MRGRRAFWSGVLAAALGLSVAELAAGVSASVPSLVTAVGTAFIPMVPPALESSAISVFGTADKLVLGVGVAVVSLMAAGLVGRFAARRPAAGAAAMAVLAGIGIAAALAAPSSRPGPVLVVGAMVVLVTVGALRWLLRLDHAVPDGPAEVADSGRRRFLVAAAGVGAAAVVTVWTGRALMRARRSVVPTDLVLPQPVEAVAPPPPAASFDGIPGLAPIVVPSDEFYRIDVNLVVPRIEPTGWSLKVTGMVDRPFELTYDELLALPMVERYITLACVSNEVGGDLVGNAAWQGVPLRTLLDRAGVHAGATQVVGRAFDGWTAGFPTAALDGDRDALVAVGMNGEPLPEAHGFPARLVVAGLYGYVSATKWLTEIELTTLEGFDGYWIPRGWAKQAPVKISSRVDVPAPNATVDAGDVVVAGVAWAPTRGIAAVELRVDDGQWLDCELTEPLSEDAWVQWRRVVPLGPGRHLLTVRAVDGRGVAQVSRYTPPRPDGATGLDGVEVNVV